MLIASWPLHEFAGFLQIISWITLPILLLSVICTMFVHYYQRQRRKKMEDGFNGKEMQQEPVPVMANAQSRSIPESFQQARYRALKKDFDVIHQKYLENEEELSSLSSEMKRQDHVIDQLRSDVVSLEKSLSNLRLALQLKEEQLSSMKIIMEEKNLETLSQISRPAVIAAEIS